MERTVRTLAASEEDKHWDKVLEVEEQKKTQRYLDDVRQRKEKAVELKHSLDWQVGESGDDGGGHAACCSS